MSGSIADDILEGLDDAARWLDGNAAGVRATTVLVPDRIDVRAVRAAVGATQVQFARRFGIPVDTLRKWERGVREPDAAGKAYLTLILRNARMVEETLHAA
ncbi:MAG: hypothetical protein RLY86_2824 [Pseudomonadota bacterium]|jgi:putative transcriptional regulator